MIYLDLDDFCEDNTSWDLLLKLKDKIPAVKVNLFTIVGRCSKPFIEFIREIPWVDMLPHGFSHNTSRECQFWDIFQGLSYLDMIEPLGLTKIFKAPGWQISEGMYRALLKRGYVVADQAYNNARRPKDLKAYILDSPNKIHGHLGHVGGHNANELSLIMPEILKHRNEEFGFIKDLPELQYA